MRYVEDIVERISAPALDECGLEIAVLLEKLCQCSLRDDDDGVATFSALLERRLIIGAVAN